MAATTPDIVRGNPQSKLVTILFLTVVHELREDLGRFQFTIDRCFTDVEQANERVDLLQRCNTRQENTDVVRRGNSHKNGCCWASLTDVDSHTVRYFVEAECIWMLGEVSTSDKTASSTSTYAYPWQSLSPLEHDLGGHIFVVAAHEPERTSCVAFDGKPSKMPWAVQAVHASCSDALARAEKIWTTTHLPQHGPAQHCFGHYHLCRFALLPSYGHNMQDCNHLSLQSTIAQVRVERVRVTLPQERIDTFVPAQALTFKKPWRPLCSGREKQILKRCGHGVQTIQMPEHDLPQEREMSDSSSLSSERKVQAEDQLYPRAPPPPLGRVLDDMLAAYTDAVNALLERSLTPSTPPPERTSPALHTFSSLCRSLSSYGQRASGQTPSKKLRRRSHYTTGQPSNSSETLSASTTLPRPRSPAAVVQMQRSMLTGTFTISRC